MKTATIFLGLAVGATMTRTVFWYAKKLGIIIGGLFAFAISKGDGIIAVRSITFFQRKN